MKKLIAASVLALAGCTADPGSPQPTQPMIAEQVQTRGATAEQIADAARSGVIPSTFTARERQTVAWLRGE